MNPINTYLEKNDFKSPLLYKVYKYLICLARFRNPNIHKYFTREQIKLLFDKAFACYPKMREIYNSGMILTYFEMNYMGYPMKWPKKSTYRAIINKLPFYDNVYGKALALETFFYDFADRFHKDDIDRTDEEMDSYTVILYSKEIQLTIMDEMFGGIHKQIKQRRQKCFIQIRSQRKYNVR